MAYVNLKSMPKAKKEYVFSFPELTGGINIRELDYRIESNESPNMKNLRFRDGVLSSRDGQVWKNSNECGEGRTAYQYLWHGFIFSHIGTKIVCFGTDGTRTDLFSGLSNFNLRGTFFVYGDKLYYKTKGYYIAITATESQGTYSFSASSVTSGVAYVPITYINCVPANGSGDLYQPENRLSPKKTLWYNAEHKVTVSASKASLVPEIVEYTWLSKYNKSGTYIFTYSGSAWVIGGEEILLSDFGISCSGTPDENDTITVVSAATDTYYLPIKDENLSIDKILVDDVEQEPEDYTVTHSPSITSVSIDKEVWSSRFSTSVNKTFTYMQTGEYWVMDGNQVELSYYGIIYTGSPSNQDTIEVDYTKGTYDYDAETGKITFSTAPPITIPETNNTVKITYSLENETAYNNIMDCRYVSIYGGVSDDLCIIMAGSETQPNAYFWNGQTSIAMDPTYFPMSQYQVAGELSNPITGFGKQQSYLIIFSEGSVGRTTLDTTEIEERTTIDLPYTSINSKIGCNLPWTIQLVENNLVFANTEQGVHFLSNTSAAYENNIVCISTKINGTVSRTALLFDIRKDDPDSICSLDTDHRYWIVANGRAWLWDYDLSSYTKPSWFLYSNIKARSLIISPESRSLFTEDIWHIDALGRLTHFENSFSDYGEGIDKVYRFSTQFFDTYDVYKNINSVMITMRSDTWSSTTLKYFTDYGERYDPTPLITYTWRLSPRNLSKRNMSISNFAARFRRKAMCRRVAHFSMELQNSNAGEDMSIATAQVFYNFQGGQR